MVIKTNPEFGIELALVVPYAYYLHTQGKLDTVITSKGMKPFYYFCEDVREDFNSRTIDNSAAGLDELPNNWIHGFDSMNKPGDLNYDEWATPPYRDYYKNDDYQFSNKVVFITNKYNIEHGHEPYGYFDIKCLYDIFTYLTSVGYDVIYKRPLNTEFVVDQNEMRSAMSDMHIVADVDGVGLISDRDLPKYFDNVHLFDDLIKDHSYNKTQMKIMANTDYFISQSGGNTILSCMWDRPVITYLTQGKELRPNYFGENSYFQRLSNQKCIPIYDVIGKINSTTYNHHVNNTGKNDYNNLIKKIKEEIK